jgi:replicative DNA helicase
MVVATIPLGPNPDDLPKNYDMEQAFLGACLCNNEVFYDADQFLRPEHFADALHGRIYAAVGLLLAENKRPTRIR